MKKQLLTFSVLLALVIAGAWFNSTTGSSTGAPAGHANDPASGFSNCTTCHTGTAIVATPSKARITTNIPSSGYIPGQTYTITATVSDSGRSKFGFQVSPQSPTGTFLGTMVVTNTTITQLISSAYITHTSAGTSGFAGKTWSFNWVAPAAGSGPVGFYGSFNATNSSSTTLGDIIYITSTTVQENSCTITPVITAGADTICPQSQTTITATGGVNYIWSNGVSGPSIVAGPGTYTVTATDLNGCSGTATKTIFATPINKPTGLIASSITSTSVKIKWTKAACAGGYKIRIRPVGTSTWRNISVGDTSEKTVFNLTASTNYEYQLASISGTISSVFTVSRFFTTSCACNLPVVSLGTVTSSTAQLNWVDDACGVQYRIQFRKQGLSTWTSVMIGDTASAFLITGLQASQTYEYRARRECNASGTINSGWSAISTFTTLPLRLGEELTQDEVRLLRAVDALGREVDPESKGLIIFQYSDGTTRKVFRKE